MLVSVATIVARVMTGTVATTLSAEIIDVGIALEADERKHELT